MFVFLVRLVSFQSSSQQLSQYFLTQIVLFAQLELIRIWEVLCAQIVQEGRFLFPQQVPSILHVKIVQQELFQQQQKVHFVLIAPRGCIQPLVVQRVCFVMLVHLQHLLDQVLVPFVHQEVIKE
jgi:hypothetical protein